MTILRSALVTAFVLLVAGCGSIQRTDETMKRGDDTADQGRRLASSLQERKPASKRETVIFTNEQLVDLRPIPFTKRKGSAESLNCSITFAPQTPIDLLEFGQQVTRLCGFPVRVTSDALAVANGQQNASTPGNLQGSAGMVPPPGQPLPNLPSLPGISGAGARTGNSTFTGFGAGSMMALGRIIRDEPPE